MTDQRCRPGRAGALDLKFLHWMMSPSSRGDLGDRRHLALAVGEPRSWTMTRMARDLAISWRPACAPRFLGDLVNMGIKIPGNYFDPSQPL